jgi:hypothetical protein
MKNLDQCHMFLLIRTLPISVSYASKTRRVFRAG